MFSRINIAVTTFNYFGYQEKEGSFAEEALVRIEKDFFLMLCI